MTTYKPGQIAVATVRGVPDVRVFRDDTGYWKTATPVGPTGGFHAHADSHVTDVRPLVVLDLSSPSGAIGVLRENADGGYVDHGSYGAVVLRFIADQIEAQTRPAIEEPTGLGAVVRDRDGRVWSLSAPSAVFRWYCAKSDTWGAWADFHAAEVLSQGWSE